MLQRQGCTNPGWQIATVTKLFALAPKIYRFSIWNLFDVTLLVLRIWGGFCMIEKCLHPYSKGCVEVGEVMSIYGCMKFKAELVGMCKIWISDIGAVEDSNLLSYDAVSTGK